MTLTGPSLKKPIEKRLSALKKGFFRETCPPEGRITICTEENAKPKKKKKKKGITPGP